MRIQLEFFPDGCQDCPLILIYGTDTDASRSLQKATLSLANDSIPSIQVDKLDQCSFVDGCRLNLELGTRDLDVRKMGPNVFLCTLKKITWAQVAGLVEPFCAPFEDEGVHFQYVDTTSNISLLISNARSW